MNKTYYDKKYFQDRLEGQKCMAFSIYKFLEKQETKKVLDVGCGSGWLTRYLRERGLKVTGCDNAEESIKLARKVVKPSSAIVKASATNLPFENKSFDAVLGVSIVEHLTKTEAKKFLKEASRVLKKRGWIFLVTPNLATPLRLIVGKKWGGYSDPTHINLYTPGGLKKLVKNYSFTNFRLTFPYYSDIPFDWWMPNSIYKTPKVIKNIITFLIVSTPLSYLRFSFWLAAQKE